jgi:hypothetical protein
MSVVRGPYEFLLSAFKISGLDFGRRRADGIKPRTPFRTWAFNGAPLRL